MNPIITIWQIRRLKEPIYSDDSPVFLEGTEDKVKAEWEKGGYAKSNTESIEQLAGLFKVTYERLDDPNANADAIKKHENHMAAWKKLQGTITINEIYIIALHLMDEKDIDSHCSDLYLKKTIISTKIIASYESKENVTEFKCNIDGTKWYDIPFAYPYKS